MWSVAAILMMAGAFAAALALAGAVRRRPLAIQALLAFALVVVLEAVVLNALSLVHAVSRAGVLGAHAAVLAALAAAGRGEGSRALRALPRRARRTVRGLGWPGVLLVPLAGLVVASAWRYAPNNWDSMTYHLARVAHWIQHRSVEPYPTNVLRQVLLMPGAEYVLASLQVVAGTDRLASSVQLAAWGLVVLAAPALARAAGAPRRVAPWAAALAAGVPMAVLQASSTQNDLVAAALALAAWGAALPLVHRAGRAWRAGDVVLLAAALTAGALVKASALVAAAPALAFAAARTAPSVRAGGARRAAVALAGAALVAAVGLGPEVARRRALARAPEATALAARYVYPIVGEAGDRAQNLLRGVVRHVPAPPRVVAAAGVSPREWCAEGAALCGDVLLRAHEDYAGNPVHVGVVAVAAALLVARGRRVPARGRLAVAGAIGAWLLFHLAFRDNAWISRLETPTFALAALAPAALGGAPGRRARAAAAALGVAALAWGTAVAARNETRPPLGSPPSHAPARYYASQPGSLAVHDVVLAAAREVGCRRLGLFVGEDSWDYPLTWRAMQAGVEVRHVLGEDPWPCLVYADREVPPAALPALRWRPTNVPFLFLAPAAGRR